MSNQSPKKERPKMLAGTQGRKRKEPNVNHIYSVLPKNASDAEDDSVSEQAVSPVEPAEIIAEQEATERRALRKLSNLAVMFLTASDGDRDQAVKLAEDAVDLLVESGTLQVWRYRALLSAIREGL